MRYRDLSTIYYRSSSTTKDAHGNYSKGFSSTLSSVRGTIRPETLTTDINESGVTTTGNYVIYIPRTIGQTINLKYGDGVYVDTTTYTEDPTWIVSNIPYNYLKHTILVLTKKV